MRGGTDLPGSEAARRIPRGGILVPALLLLASAAGGGDSDGFVTVRVAGEDGLPVRGARVEVLAERESRLPFPLAEASTGADGRYRVGPVPVLPSIFRVRVSAEGLETAYRSTFRGASLSFRLAPAGAIRGRVLWERTGEPVPGFLVGVSDRADRWQDRVETGADGSFAIRGVPPGACRLEGVTWRATPAAAKDVPVEAGRTTVRDLWVPEATTVFGRVTGPGGGPLAGVEVRGRFLQVRTDPEGGYRLPGIPPFDPDRMDEPDAIEFDAPGMAPAREAPVLSPGVEEFRLDVTLSPADPEAPPRGIRGVVTFDGKPVPGARIHFTPWDVFRQGVGEAGTTDATGSFRVAGPLPVPPFRTEPFRLFAATDSGLLGASDPIEAPLRGMATVSIALRSSAEVRGTVRTGSGVPVEGQRVAFSADGDWSVPRAVRYLGEVASDREGRYRIRVPAGPVTVYLRGFAGAGRELVLDGIEEGGLRTDADLATGADAPDVWTVAGVVVDEDGDPVPGVEVSNGFHARVSDAAGSFVLEGMGESIEVVLFSHPGYVDEARFHVRKSRLPFAVVMRRGGGIRGHVEPEPGGAPVRSFRILAIPRSGDGPDPLPGTGNDAGGRFLLEGLAAGTYDVRAEARGRHSAWVRGIEVAPGRPIPERTLRLLSGARITGTLKDQGGAPCPNEEIRGRGPFTEEGEGPFRTVATTDATGVYVWACLEAGRYRVRVKGDVDFEEVSRVVEVGTDGAAVVDLVRVRTPR